MLDEGVANGSHKFDVPSSTMDNEVNILLQKLKEKNFDPGVEFDPNVHLLYKEDDFFNTRVLTLRDLNITKTHVQPISDVAVTDPFPLFTIEATDIMKWESFQINVVSKYGRVPLLAKGHTSTDIQISGSVKSHAPFTYKAWTHPKTREIINKFAGVDLQVMFDYEIAHINASLISNNYDVTEESQKLEMNEDETSIYSWHYDSNSFVCVLMLSANPMMIGGETGLKDGNENIVTIKDPKVGFASILQGRVIRHIAYKPKSNDERISAVTGYIPANCDILDSTVLTSLKPSVLPRSNHDEYYPEWIDYRFRRIEERLKKHRSELLHRCVSGGKFNQLETIKFCTEIENYLVGSWEEFEVVCDNEYPPKLFDIHYSDL